jgi:hypothetical protein
MRSDRRQFPSLTSNLELVAGSSAPAKYRGADSDTDRNQYKYRIAFELWINDVRNEAMPQENWPYGELDDKTVDGILRALDVQSESGYNFVDFAGLWTTYAWPVDVGKVVDRDRQRRISGIINAAHERKMKVVCFPSGILNWGMDDILMANPSLQTDNKHELNPLNEGSWKWQYKVFDYVADNYDIDGYHLEAADQGRCGTTECMEQWPDNVAYYCYVTGKLADYLRHKYPSKILITTVQGFGSWGRGFDEGQMSHLLELTNQVDCLFDQGHHGPYVPPEKWREFIPKLHCSFGNSGDIWIYPPQRWERNRWFLPYISRTGQHMKEFYQAGGRGVMYYQGPVENPSTEVNIAAGGRLMTNIGRSVEDVLAETLELIYRPKNPVALGKLVKIYQKAEGAYFGQWDDKRILEQLKVPRPGELHLTNLFGASPGASSYLMEPFLDANGRLQYKQGLTEIYKDISQIEHEFNDQGRIARIRQGIDEALADINNVAMSKDEKQVWDDQNVGLLY